jgi:hypothetical protein
VAYAAIRKLCHREPLWINVQDLPAEAGKATGIGQSPWFHRAGSFVQSLLFNRGDVWSSISPEMVRQLESTAGSSHRPVHYCPNWLTESLAQQLRPLSSKVGRPLQQPLELLYCGTIGRKQGLLNLCQKLATFSLDFRFTIHGAGGEAGAVKAWLNDHRDARFRLGGLLPEAEFVRAIHNADWFVISETPGAGFSFLPSKLIPSVSIGTPVLAVADSSGPLGREMAEHGLGIAVEWSQLDQLPSRLIDVQRDPQRLWDLQENCLRRAASFDRDRAIDRIERLLLRMALQRTLKTPTSREPTRCRAC